jgi:hypothetical protein
MKAIVQDRYGSPGVLELRDVDNPDLADDGRARASPRGLGQQGGLVLPERHAVRRTRRDGLLKPKQRVLGVDFAGTVEGVGIKPAKRDVGAARPCLWRRSRHCCSTRNVEPRAIARRRSRHRLHPRGLKVRLAALHSSQKVVFLVAKLNKPDLVVLRELLEAGKVAPVIERRYELSEIGDALRYLGEGHAQGKIAITLT